MAKKSSVFSLYLCGLILVVIGCFLPLTASKFFGGGSSAISAITDGSGDLKVAAILALVGAVVGIVACFVSLGNNRLIKLVSLIVSVAGGVYMVLSYLNLAPWAKNVVKLVNKGVGNHIGIGLIVILAGWVIAIIGYLQNRD